MRAEPVILLAILAAMGLARPLGAATEAAFDVVIVGGTPGGITAAVATARGGHTAVLLERTAHVGGLPANGLGATDIATRGATGGLFAEFVGRVRSHYVEKYGEASPQVKDSSDGYHFEPHVAEAVFEAMLAEHAARVTVLKGRQFDALPERVTLAGGAVAAISVINCDTGALERYAGKVFIDATYEGDLAAAAGAPYRLGREGHAELGEPMAGRVYKAWGGEVGAGSTGLADNAVQAYNYRLCLTRRADNRVAVPKPDRYDREEFASLVEDVATGRTTGRVRGEQASEGVGRIVNMVTLPEGKTDANNQHLAFISTDLPEENWPWPTSEWDWRDRFAQRLRDYTLGLLWFAQNDPALPEDFRKRCAEWGLAKDEYADNGNFPRQVYVREGRRIESEHLFTAHDALPTAEGSRPPVYETSITASHYALDSHAVRKRESGRIHLDGFFSWPTKPYTVPYGVMVPKGVEGLLAPVPAGGTHVGFSTLRMEPCWMALGQAAGAAACVAIESGTTVRGVDLAKVQQRLLDQGAVLIYFQDAKPGDAHYAALQYLALRGYVRPSEWQAHLEKPVTEAQAAAWIAKAGGGAPEGYAPGRTTRGELLEMLYARVLSASK